MKIWKAKPIRSSVLLLVSWLLVGGYLGLVASDRYVSEAKFIVQRNGGEAQQNLNISSLIGGVGTLATTDSLMLKVHIQSKDMYESLDKKLALRQHYSQQSEDPVSRLEEGATKEEFYRYMKKKIHVSYDDASSIITVSAESYSPQKSREIVKNIVALSESFINNVGYTLARDQVEFASMQLVQTRNEMESAKQTVLKFQNEHGLYSPEVATESVTSIVAKLEAILATEKASLKALTSYLTKDAPEVMSTRAKVNSLKAQIALERKKLVGMKGDKLNKLNAKFENLKTEAKFRADTYATTLSVLEVAKIEAAHKLKHLVVVETPETPDEPTYPRKLYDMVTFVVLSTLVYWIILLAVATVKDHRD